MQYDMKAMVSARAASLIADILRQGGMDTNVATLLFDRLADSMAKSFSDNELLTIYEEVVGVSKSYQPIYEGSTDADDDCGSTD